MNFVGEKFKRELFLSVSQILYIRINKWFYKSKRHDYVTIYNMFIILLYKSITFLFLI